MHDQHAGRTGLRFHVVFADGRQRALHAPHPRREAQEGPRRHVQGATQDDQCLAHIEVGGCGYEHGRRTVSDIDRAGERIVARLGVARHLQHRADHRRACAARQGDGGGHAGRSQRRQRGHGELHRRESIHQHPQLGIWCGHCTGYDRGGYGNRIAGRCIRRRRHVGDRPIGSRWIGQHAHHRPQRSFRQRLSVIDFPVGEQDERTP